MTDTQPMAPTDTDIDALWVGQQLTVPQLVQRRVIARAALAKWGAQPAVVGEPVAWLHDCAALLTNDVELWINACPHCGKPRTTPQPTQAQAGAVPLTDTQIKELIEDGVFLGNCKEIVRAIEQVHGITQWGGQHGTE